MNIYLPFLGGNNHIYDMLISMFTTLSFSQEALKTPETCSGNSLVRLTINTHQQQPYIALAFNRDND